MTLQHAILRSIVFSGFVFAILWPALTWYLRRWYEGHWWHPDYEPNSRVAGRRLVFLGALWALLPAAYSFALALALSYLA
jgi:hypothetical protein